MSVAAVSAVDDVNDTVGSDEVIADTVSVSDDIEVVSTEHSISSSNYDNYFDNNGNLKDNVNSGDTINLAGSFLNKNFIFNKTVNVVGGNSNKFTNSMFTFLKGASGSSISNLKISNSNNNTCGVLINGASNCIIQGCVIENSGAGGYPICLANGATYNNVTANTLKTFGESYGHGTRSTPVIVLFGSHHNTLADNSIQLEDANAIYLSSYGGGPFVSQESNNNLIVNNTIKYNVLPTSWSYAIQAMGSSNTIKKNKIIGAYRGISTTGAYNIITENQIINLTGANYNNKNAEVGGECGIAASMYSTVTDNYIINAKLMSTGSGISVIDGSLVENNYVDVRYLGVGVNAAGSNVIIRNNNISTQSGVGIYEKDEGSWLTVTANNITSQTGIGILIEKISSKRMPSNVIITNNNILTSNTYAIDARGVKSGTGSIGGNNVGGKQIRYPEGVIDLDKPTYNYNVNNTYKINTSNYDRYINPNGNLYNVNDSDILIFEGNFSDKVIYVNKAIKIIGNNAIFLNSTFKVTSGGVWIENLTIINKNAERLNAWGIYVNEAPGVKIINNNIQVTDPNAAYAIYVLESSYVEVINNSLFSEGDFLTYTLLVYSCEECVFENNKIRTIGTGENYRYTSENSIEGKTYSINGTEVCVDGNVVCIDGKVYCLDGNEVCIDGVTYCLDGDVLIVKTYAINGTEVCIDGVTYQYSENALVNGDNVYTISDNKVCIDGVTYCLDGSVFVLESMRYAIVDNNVTIGSKTYCLDGNEFVNGDNRYQITDDRVCIDGVTYCLDGSVLTVEKYTITNDNEICIDGATYCLDGNVISLKTRYILVDNETCIDGVTYCLDGDVLVVNGVNYEIVDNKVTIGNVTYCIDGDVISLKNTYELTNNEVCIDGVTYCLDGDVLVVNGVNHTIVNNEVCIDGVTYCIDGNTITVDGKYYCLDGNEVFINGVRYCIDGNELVVNGTSYGRTNHIVPEIYRTYGILLLYSSVNDIMGNTLNVTSNLNDTYPRNSSENSIVGIDIYYNSHDNIVQDNIVYINANDNYIYGVGVLGYQTGHKAPEGQGASNNQFKNNKITLVGPYATTGIIIGDESEDSLIRGNTVNITSTITYGINLEGSDDSTIKNNVFILNSDVAYGVEGFKSNNNSVDGNTIKANGKEVYGMIFSGNNNNITNNNVFANGTGVDVSFSAHDALGSGNAGIILTGNATNNIIKSNNITSQKGFAIVSEAGGNVFENNYLKSEMGNSTKGINGTAGNILKNNYQYIISGVFESVEIPYLGSGYIILTVTNPDGASLDGAVVCFYDDYDINIGNVTVNDGRAILHYQLDDTYWPDANYKISVLISKTDFKTTRIESTSLYVSKGNLNVAVSDVSAKDGIRGKFTATVTNALGQPVSGLKVRFYNYDTGNKQAWGTATTDANGVATITAFIERDFVELFDRVTNMTAIVQGTDYYIQSNGTGLLTIIDIAPVTISINSKVGFEGVLATLTDNNGLAVANKQVSVNVNGKNYNVNTDAYGQVILPSVSAGSPTITITSPKDSNYDVASASAKVTVVAPITGNKNVNVYFGNTAQYKIRVADKSGNYLSYKTVTVKVNGKNVNLKTDANGYATYSVKMVGTYTITVELNGQKVSNKIVIKPTLIAKNVVKKKAKKIKFTVKLVNEKGKVLKNKKITIKVKNKKYKVKTNKKGIATLTLKKLKVGKYTVKSSYGGCTISNTIKIKK